MATATTLDKGHGRCERRTLKATTAWNEYLDRPGVAQVGQVESVVSRDGQTAHEVRSFITSVPRSELSITHIFHGTSSLANLGRFGILANGT